MANTTVVCSTPFGITDYYAESIGRSRRECEVLNAFRHHGLLRYLPFPYLTVEQKLCSTPFGITDYYAGLVRRCP